jgi:hypothetical protein
MHHKKRHSRKLRKRPHSMRGGSKMFGNNYEAVTASSGDSAWKYMSNLTGGLDQQYNGALMGNTPGNQLVLSGRTMSGGKRRRHRRKTHRRTRRGGTVIGDALIPLGLLALQQKYGKSRTKTKRK